MSKCPVHCPPCKSAVSAAPFLLIILAALMYSHMDAIAEFFKIVAMAIVTITALSLVTTATVITVKVRRYYRIRSQYKPANAVEYHRAKRAITREKLVKAGIVKTVPVSVTHTMKEIPPRMQDTISAEILESSHMILPKWAREKANKEGS